MARTVVVVDDAREILDLVCSLLREEGYAVEALGSPRVVPVYSADERSVVFLLDLMLPMMTGIELARRLRAGGCMACPMIAMSASPQLLSDARASGLFQETLDKPFDIDNLLRIVERYAA